MDQTTVQTDTLGRVRELGKTFNEGVLKATRELFVPLLEILPRDGIKLTKDHAYGGHERHLLDVHAPAPKPGKPAPVVIFFHGGGFIAGDKNSVGDLVYGNVANHFARHGILGVNATYRLAPEIKWPEGGRDVGGALAWVKENIAAHGGDPERVFLMGHSAGASHVATYAFRRKVHPEDGPGIAGAILMSGVYAIAPKSPAPNRIAYYGDDASKYDGMNTLGNLERADFPVFVTVAELDPHMFETSAIELIAQLTALNGQAPRFQQLAGHNHPSQTLTIGADGDTVGPGLVRFVRDNS